MHKTANPKRMIIRYYYISNRLIKLILFLFQCKTVSVSPDMSARCVVRQALQIVQNGTTEGDGDGEGDAENEEGRWSSANEFTLCVRTGRDAPPMPLRGTERPHAIQVKFV